MQKFRYSPNLITSLKPNEIFVFGSNMSGIHGAGAAKTALKWGAVFGRYFGFYGQTFAIPTVNEDISGKLELEKVKKYIDWFICFAKARKDLNFLVTEIGCGLAGFSVNDIAPLFYECLYLDNVYLPERFIDYLKNL